VVYPPKVVNRQSEGTHGLGIEGLAMDGHRLLLDLRGPVLRGWSALLELQSKPAAISCGLVPWSPN